MVILGMVLRIQPAELLCIRPGENRLAGSSSIALVPMAVVPPETKVNAMRTPP